MEVTVEEILKLAKGRHRRLEFTPSLRYLQIQQGPATFQETRSEGFAALRSDN